MGLLDSHDLVIVVGIAHPLPILRVCGVQKFIPHGSAMAGYVFPFDSLYSESVPIRGFTRSTGFFSCFFDSEKINRYENNALLAI